MMVIENRNEWNKILEEEFDNFDDIYFRYEYSELYRKHYSVYPEAIFWEDKNIKVFLVHLIRKISSEINSKLGSYCDLVTPYGYGGPLVIKKTDINEKGVKKSVTEFYRSYIKYCSDNNYVSEFIRFHPIFGNQRYFKNILNVEYVNDVVVINLKQNLKDILFNVKKGHRYNARKTIREGCEVLITVKPKKSDVSDFIGCYYDMLDRNNSQKKYYFPPQFIRDHFELFDSVMIKVTHKDVCVGAAIFIAGSSILHYHLSGSFKIKGIYPTDLIILEAIKWAKERGFKYLHLGGGRGRNDSLFKFKSGFSNIYKKFYIGKLIFSERVYNKLVRLAGVNPDVKFFPAYRAKLNDTIV